MADWLDWLPDGVVGFGQAVVDVVMVATPVIVVAGLAARRRWRRMLTVVVTAAAAAIAFTVLADDASAVWLASAVAVAVAVRPWCIRVWRRIIGWSLVAFGATLICCSVATAVDVGLAAVVGNVVGAAVLVVVGAPNRRPTPSTVIHALADAGVDVRDVTLARAVSGRAQLYRAVLADGSTAFVKVYGDDVHDADRLNGGFRALLLRQPLPPALSPRFRVEHEALLLTLAREAGIRTPAAVAVAAVPGGSMALAMSEVAGHRLDSLPPEEIGADMLDALWREVAQLHRAGLAHRSLRVENVLIDGGRPALVGLGVGEVAASPHAQAIDRAELLASLSALVGQDAAVGAAARVLEPPDLAAAMPYLQRWALSRTTQRRSSPADLEALRRHIADVTHEELAPLVKLVRVRPRTVVMVVTLTAAFYILLPQLANVDEGLDSLGSANWWWLTAAAVMSILTYVFAAIGLMGASAVPLPFGRTVEAQLASSFVNRLTPANVGGLALNVRFMQKRGIEPAAAISATGLNLAAGALVHAGLLVVSLAWAGQDQGQAFSLPSSSTLLIVLAVALAVVGLVVASRRARRLVRTHVLGVLRELLSSLVVLARSPVRLAALLGGSLGVTVVYGAALVCVVMAFGGGVGIAEISAVYLGAAALAAVAPTPGGLGALEAALVAGLTAAGLEPGAAVASVLTYRLLTYWLPIAPGWLSFHVLERRGDI